MIIPDPDFRPNPNRAIYVQGLIDQQLVNRLTPKIISLQSQSRDPITIYIDSPGGLVAHMQALLNLLTASNQDFAAPCHLITVVTTQAASAARNVSITLRHLGEKFRLQEEARHPFPAVVAVG